MIELVHMVEWPVVVAYRLRSKNEMDVVVEVIWMREDRNVSFQRHLMERRNEKTDEKGEHRK